MTIFEILQSISLTLTPLLVTFFGLWNSGISRNRIALLKEQVADANDRVERCAQQQQADEEELHTVKAEKARLEEEIARLQAQQLPRGSHPTQAEME